MKCSNCNHQLREGTTECPYCGAQVNETNQNTRQENPYQTQYSQMNNYDNNGYQENNENPYNQNGYQEYNQDINNAGYDFSNGFKNPYMQQGNNGYNFNNQYGQSMNECNQDPHNIPQKDVEYGFTPPLNPPYGDPMDGYNLSEDIYNTQQPDNGFTPLSNESYEQSINEHHQDQDQYNIQQSNDRYESNGMYGRPMTEYDQNSYNMQPQDNENRFTPPFNGSYKQPTEGYYQDQSQGQYNMQQPNYENNQYYEHGYENLSDNSGNMYENDDSEYQYGNNNLEYSDNNQQQDYNQNYDQGYDLRYSQQQHEESLYDNPNVNYNNSHKYNSEGQYYNDYNQNINNQNYGYNEQDDNYYQNIPEATIPNQEPNNNEYQYHFGAPGTDKRRQEYSDQYNNFNGDSFYEDAQSQQDYNNEQPYDYTSPDNSKNEKSKLKNKSKKKEKKKNSSPANKISTGLCILSFLIPIVGIILYFVKKKENKSFANTYGICAIVGIVFSYIIFSSVTKNITKDLQQAAQDNSSSISQLLNDLESEDSKTTEDANNNVDVSNTNDQTKPVVSNQKININGTDIELPCKYSDFAKKTGYSFGEIMSKGSFIDGALITATKENSSIMLQITGEQDSEGLVKVQTCDISGIVVSKKDKVNDIDIGNAEISFFNDVKIGNTETLESLTEKIGKPSLDADSSTDGSKSHIYQWKSANYLLEITTIDDVIDSISYTYPAQ